jgi:hypothetical protein
MTPEAQNIAIINRTGILGDHYHDLNACAEAEKTLHSDAAKYGNYCRILNVIACRLSCGNTHSCGYTISATAPHRCEGMLRVWGLWIEGETK